MQFSTKISLESFQNLFSVKIQSLKEFDEAIQGNILSKMGRFIVL